ncbi:MAG: SDR family oxidoreductase [Gammaproteobacteria bacterium]|nr:SDR family oxidoreductase [Gammaproteobacteria bacterium]
MKNTILISGTNRGIGLELVKYYANLGWRVHACCREPDAAKALSALADGDQVILHKLDVSDSRQIQHLARELSGEAIDILFNNAGIYGQADAEFGNVDEQQWLDCFRINAMSPLFVAEAFVNHVAASEKRLIATMSSKMGSMADNGSGGSYAYRSSKAAVNAVVKSMSIDLKPRGIKVVALHPGWVLTDMGGPNAEITTEESVKSLARNMESVNLENTGCFLDIDGSVIGW